MPGAMKLPQVHPGPSKPEPGRDVEPALPAPVVCSYTLGRLRPRFTTQGAWHELASLLHGQPLPAPDSAELDGALARLFALGPRGELPSSFYLARELVWPIVDVLGVPQAVVVPESDEEIVELLANLSPSTVQCAAGGWSLVRGEWVGFVEGLGARLDGLPRIRLVSAFPYVFEPKAPSGCDGDAERLFRAYQPLLANNGIGDEQRAINLVLTASKAFYELAMRLDERSREQAGARLVAMNALPVDAPRSRPLVDVVFSFLGTETGTVRRWFQRVAMGSPFPYLVTADVLPYYQRPAAQVRPQSAMDEAPEPAIVEASVGEGVDDGRADLAAQATARDEDPGAAPEVGPEVPSLARAKRGPGEDGEAA